MKRTLAIFLTLLLLLPLTGCKEAKNYTVKEVDGKKRIFLNQNEIDRIEKEIEEKGYSITPLKGFEDEDYGGRSIVSYFEPDEERLVKDASIAAKCHLVKERQVTRFDVYYPTTTYRETGFGTIYTMKIDKLFYTDGEEKKGDIITAYFPNNMGSEKVFPKDNYFEEGNVVKLCTLIVPEEDLDFYILLQREPTVYGKNKAQLKMMREATDFFYFNDYTVIFELEPGKYELGRCLTGLAEGGIPQSESVRGLNCYLEKDNFDERFQNWIDQYKQS